MENNKKSDELIRVYKELAFELEEKGKVLAELMIARKEIISQSDEKGKLQLALKAAYTELAFQKKEKCKRADELEIANIELDFQKVEKAKRASELLLANKELIFQNEEKGKRSAELIIANIELAFQNQEKAKRAAELVIANKEHVFQSEEKEKRSVELSIANVELIFQNEEKEKRAAELIVANKELAYQNDEKVKRAAELGVANIELAYQNAEKEKRATELIMVNKELEQFAYIASHDLQQPLRTVSNYMKLFEEKYNETFDEEAHKYLQSVNNATKRMSLLITSLLTFSQLGSNKTLKMVNCGKVIEDVIEDLQILIKTSKTTIVVAEMPILNIYETEMRQLFQNLITNAIKFQKVGSVANISILAIRIEEKWQFAVSDNGIGIDSIYYDKIFDIFQRLHGNKEYQGSGIGLANCKKIVQMHHGEIWLESLPEIGSTFYFTIPNLTL